MPPTTGVPREGARGMYTPRGYTFPEHVRVSHAERDQVVEKLSDAFAQGCLDEVEFQHRMQAAMTARTRGDLAPLLADVPGSEGPPVATPMPMPVPRPSTTSASERTWAALSHASALCSGFVGPLVVLLAMGRESAFVRKEAAESLNFQLCFLLANIGLALAVVPTLGLVVLVYPLAYPALWIAWFVFILVGSVTSVLGKPYRYPLNLRLVR